MKETIQAGSFLTHSDEAILTLRRILERSHYYRCEEIALLPSVPQVLAQLLIRFLRTLRGAGEKLHNEVAATHHPAYVELFKKNYPATFELWSLFTLGLPAGKTSLSSEVMSDDEIALLRKEGIMRTGEDRISSNFLVTAIDDFYLLSTFLKKPGGEHVFIAGESAILARELKKRLEGLSLEKGLDIGTGTGIQAFMLSRFCRQVTAVDVNFQALRIAKANAALNRIGNVSFTFSDLYRGIGSSQFELIVTNPPYVFLSDARKGDRWAHGGGQRGTEIPMKILEGMERHLVPGGRLIMITVTPVIAGEDYFLKRLANTFREKEYSLDYRIFSVTHELPEPELYRRHGIRKSNRVILEIKKNEPFSLRVERPPIMARLMKLLSSPRTMLFELLQYLHFKRLKKKSARENQLFLRAVRQLGRGNYERAEYNFNRVLELNPCHYEAHFHIGTLFRDTGREEEAAVHFQSVLMG